MKLQHTPGPWRVEEHDDGYLQIETDYKNGFNDVIVCNGLYKSGGICDKKNARLIAAAPEMLDALLREYELFKNIYDMGLLMLGTQMQEKFERALEIKKSAIERATGLTIGEVLEHE